MDDNTCSEYVEQVIPGRAPYRTYQNQIAKYIYASKIVKGKVLDIGCAYGNGTEYLSRKSGNMVVGIEIQKEAVKFARSKYKRKNLFYLVADATRLPLKDNSFETVVGFEIIEHLSYAAFLKEISRVLSKRGLFLCSTPNKVFSSPFRAKPYNPYHLKEFFLRDFIKVLRNNFIILSIYSQERISTFRVLFTNITKLMPRMLYIRLRAIYSRLFNITNRNPNCDCSEQYLLSENQLDPAFKISPVKRKIFSIQCYFISICRKRN